MDTQQETPTVSYISVVIPAYNEENVLGNKMVELKNTCFVLEPLHLGVTPCIQLYVAANHQNSRLLDSTIRLTNTQSYTKAKDCESNNLDKSPLPLPEPINRLILYYCYFII